MTQTTYEVRDGDGFTIREFSSREEAQQYIDETLEDFRQKEPLSVKEGRTPWMSIYEARS
jgi:hypothetical protein